MGENQPLVGFVNIIIRNNVRKVIFWFKPCRRNTDVVRQVTPHLGTKRLDDGLNAAAGIKDIVHDKQAVFPVGLPDDVLQAVDPDRFISFFDAGLD